MGAGSQIKPTETVVVTGLGCRTVTFFTGYRQISSRTLPLGLSPVRASPRMGVR